jgi:hypothetical protein
VHVTSHVESLRQNTVPPMPSSNVHAAAPSQKADVSSPPAIVQLD